LKKFISANSDGVNNLDPSGNITLSEINTAINSMSRFATQASANFAKSELRGGWRELKKIGDTGEKIVKQIIEECIKPKTLSKGAALGGGSRRRLDFDLFDEAGDLIYKVESKSKLPNVGSEAMRRLKNQLLDAQRAGHKNIAVVGGDRVSEAHLKKFIEYLKKENVDVSQLDIFNGFVDFARWGATFYAEECFEVF
jgi:hypothetical protein